MRDKKLDQLILQLENYVECWKQFNSFIAMARAKKFTMEDENQFLEIKSILVQQLEIIISRIESGTPSREEIHSLVALVPSIRYISEAPEGTFRNVEKQWHKLFLSWQDVLGLLKVRQQEASNKSFFSSLFGKKKPR